ncbi:hypothetical protein AB4Z35_26045 [Pseudomonas sp. KB_15]
MSVQPVKIDDLPIGRFHIKIAGLTLSQAGKAQSPVEGGSTVAVKVAARV